MADALAGGFHQPASTGGGEFAPRVDSRHLMARRESDKLINVVAKQRVDADLERLNSIAYKGCESILYFDRVARGSYCLQRRQEQPAGGSPTAS